MKRILFPSGGLLLRGENRRMLLSILKVISLAFLWVGSSIPLTASESLISKDSVLADVSWDSPQAVRKQVVEKCYEKYSKVLGQGLFEKIQKPDSEDKIYAIEYLRAEGEEKAKSKGEFKDFVPDISDKPIQPGQVSIHLAATDFLTKSLSSFETNEGNNRAIRESALNNMESLLKLRGKAKESKEEEAAAESQFRDATNTERKIILAATAGIAREHYNKGKEGTYDFAYWKAHFDKQHGKLLSDETVKATINTRATAAALVWVALQNKVAQMQDQMLAIYKAFSIQKEEVFKGLIEEINQATEGGLANLLKALPAPDSAGPSASSSSAPLSVPLGGKILSMVPTVDGSENEDGSEGSSNGAPATTPSKKEKEDNRPGGSPTPVVLPSQLIVNGGSKPGSSSVSNEGKDLSADGRGPSSSSSSKPLVVMGGAGAKNSGANSSNLPQPPHGPPPTQVRQTQQVQAPPPLKKKSWWEKWTS